MSEKICANCKYAVPDGYWEVYCNKTGQSEFEVYSCERWTAKEEEKNNGTESEEKEEQESL